MKFIVDHLELRAALAFVASAAAKPRGVIPILSHVLIVAKDGAESIEFATTNLDLTARIHVDAIVREGGSFTVEFSALSDIAKNAAASVKCELMPNLRLVVESDRARFEIPVLSADDFPDLPDMGNVKTVEFSPGELLPMLRSASYAVSPETRFSWPGVVMAMQPRALDVVSTDGHRMALLSMQGNYPAATVMLAGPLVAATSKLTVAPGATVLNMRWTDDHVELSIGRMALIGRRTDVNFIRYREAIRRDLKATITIDRQRLADTVARVMPFAREGKTLGKALRLDIADAVARLSCADERGSSRDEVPCDYSGPPIMAGFSAPYLADVLAAIQTETVTLQMADDNTQMIVKPVGYDLPHEAMHVIMQMRLA